MRNENGKKNGVSKETRGLHYHEKRQARKGKSRKMMGGQKARVKPKESLARLITSGSKFPVNHL